MANIPDFQKVQHEFCAHLRDPLHAPAPSDIEDRRMAIYRRLFFNNIHGLVQRAFPIIARILGDPRMRETCYNFYSQYGCQTPYFHQIGSEFVRYITEDKPEITEQFPYLAELADYEWIEVRLRVAEEEPSVPDMLEPENPEDLMNHCLVLAPTLAVRVYEWPVHQLKDHEEGDFEKPDSPATLLLFRNRKGKVQVIDLNPASARLMLGLQLQPDTTAEEQLDSMLNESGQKSQPLITQGALATLQHLYRKGAILGFLGR